jgi:hypothetical protein
MRKKRSFDDRCVAHSDHARQRAGELHDDERETVDRSDPGKAVCLRAGYRDGRFGSKAHYCAFGSKRQ